MILFKFRSLIILSVFIMLGNTSIKSENGNWINYHTAGIVRAVGSSDLTTYIPIVLKQEFKETIFGVEIYDITAKGGLYRMNDAGITWIRHNDAASGPPTNALVWTAVEPVKGSRNWSTMAQLEKELINANELGIKVILIVRSTPEWARVDKNSPCGAITPSEYNAFAEFLYDAVKRYSGPKYNVKFWEIYNEPGFPRNSNNPPYGDPHGCWGDPGDLFNNGQAYGDMLKVVYPRIKDADPEANVLVGGLLMDCDPRPNLPENKSQCDITNPGYTSQSKFLEGILLSGAGNSFDGISFHAYDYYPYWEGYFGTYYNEGWGTNWNTKGPVLIAKTEFIKEVLAKYGATGKDLYNTESALLNTNPIYDGIGVCKPYDTNYENTKSSHIVQSYVAAKSLDLRANIHFHTTGWRCSALLENGETVVQPAYDSYSFASRMLRYSSFVREITSFGPNIIVYEFKNDNNAKVIWVTWSLDGANYPISLPSEPSKVWYFDGRQQIVSGNIFTVKLEPHYIEY